MDFIPGPTVDAFVRQKSFTGFPALELIKYSWRHDAIAQTTCAHD